MTRDALMAQYTTLHLGGCADLFAEPATPEQVQLLLTEARRAQVPVTIIGHGSNLLVRDGGIRGLVIRIAREMRGIAVRGEEVRAEAGAMMSAVAMAAAESSLEGLAFASGIPGTIGGGAFMNAGAYGGEMSQVVTRVEGFHMDGTPFAYTGAEMGFTYRESRLQHEDAVITAVTCRLRRGNREAILAEMVELNRRRAEKQPLTVPSAGSTFRRPEGHYASALVDECGLKGATVGGAQVSPKHAGFLTNQGGTAADFLALIAHVQKVVWEQKGVRLEPEVRILGEDTPRSAV
ncbi:MAG: UDP-N-acetylmuramate dehydrogenase [Clostridia bacterium]|nr:UDP-N-acetylmuramate dehydrogenase [Clostridia bacterium]